MYRNVQDSAPSRKSCDEAKPATCQQICSKAETIEDVLFVAASGSEVTGVVGNLTKEESIGRSAATIVRKLIERLCYISPSITLLQIIVLKYSGSRLLKSMQDYSDLIKDLEQVDTQAYQIVKRFHRLPKETKSDQLQRLRFEISSSGGYIREARYRLLDSYGMASL